jgi:hypothetical protein
MDSLSNEMLIETYFTAKNMKLNNHFILLLEFELKMRNLAWVIHLFSDQH